jgi:hypothetical protein
MMEIGMLWFDNDKNKPLTEKILQAAEYYTKKYGKKPDTCLVNSLELGRSGQSSGNVAGIQLAAMDSVQPHHLWIGRDK